MPALPLFSEPDESLKDALRTVLKRELFPGTFDTAEAWLRAWFDPLELTLEDGKIYVGFPHSLFAAWFDQHGRKSLERAADRIWGEKTCLVYKNAISGTTPASLPPDAPRGQRPVAQKKIFPKAPPFGSFFCSGKNESVLNILQGMVEGSRVYTPLLLRGTPGTGKTHLLRATAHALSSTGETLFFSAPDFAELFQKKGRSEARNILRACAALCVDDIHLLAGQTDLQDELTTLIDDFAPMKRPLLCAAMTSPELSDTDSSHKTDLMANLKPALLSRLDMGMVLELAEPDLDVRLRYAQAKLAEYGLDKAKDIPLLLARRCAGLRRLHGVILRIDAFRSQSGRLPDESDMDTILRSTGNTSALTPDAVLALVAARCGYTSRDLRGRRRDPKLVLARQIAMYLCRELLGESYPSLGRMFGGKDHSTVIYAVKKMREKVVTNKDVHIIVAELTKTCRQHLSQP